MLRMSSLKQLIRESPEVRRRFAEVLPRSDAGEVPCMPMIVEPPTKYSAQKASLIGTAFDYLLRFHLQRLNAPVVKTRRWVAEAAVEDLEEATTRKITGWHEEYVRDAVKARGFLEEAKQHLAAYLYSGRMSDALVRSALNLATLDPIIRAGAGYETIGMVSADDVLDVQRLFQAVGGSLFEARDICLLNPTFGESPDFALGADADLVIDDAIIDIKTSQTLRLNRSDLDQLIGYFLLNELVGFSGVAPRVTVRKAGIYFSRHAYLHLFPIRQLISEGALARLLPWFKQTATDCCPQDLDWKPPLAGPSSTQHPSL